MIKHVRVDWSESQTLPTELWKNPLFDAELQLQLADGAVHFERLVNQNLRQQIEQLRAQLNQLQQK